MNKPITLGISLITILLCLINCKSGRLTDNRDNFESDTLNKIWKNDKFIPGALSFQSKYVRSGSKAAMIVLHQGDQIDKERGTNLERAELKEAKKLVSTENSNYAYSFSLFLPPDFPIVPKRLVIAQWKQDCELDNCNPDNPVIALRFKAGEFYITLQTSPDQKILYSQKESILGQWLDFKFHIRFSRNPDGGIKGWLNGKQIIDYNGVTAYSQTYGYPMPGVYYFKTGLYRDLMSETMTIYIDDYVKKAIPEL